MDNRLSMQMALLHCNSALLRGGLIGVHIRDRVAPCRALVGLNVFGKDMCTLNGIPALQVLSSDIDLLHPPADLEKQKHKTKRLVQSPNSFFMDVKCQGCFQM